MSGVRDLYATPTLRWRDTPLVHRRDFVEHLASADLPAPAQEPWPPNQSPAGGYWRTRPIPRSWRGAHAAGALGLVVPHGVDAEGWMPKMIAGPPVQELPILDVRTDLHAHMSAAGGEVTASMPVRTVEVTGTLRKPALTDQPTTQPTYPPAHT